MGNPVVHFEITGKDGGKLADFYRKLFGWKIDADNPMNYGVVETESGDKGINGGIGQTPEGPGHVTIYVEVDDPQAALDEAEKLGGKVVMGVEEIPNMVTFALFADPEGHVVGVVKGGES